MANYPVELKYTKEHEWARIEGDLVRVGITEYAVEQLGDVTLLDLPEEGTELDVGGHFGDIESVKAVSELYAPISGQVVEVNGSLADNPELVNDDPYDRGWMVVIQASDPAQLEQLMDAAAYQAFLGKL